MAILNSTIPLYIFIGDVVGGSVYFSLLNADETITTLATTSFAEDTIWINQIIGRMPFFRDTSLSSGAYASKEDQWWYAVPRMEII